MAHWVKLHEGIETSEVFRDLGAWNLFTYLLTKACYAPSKVKGVNLKRGQCLFSLNTLASTLGYSKVSLIKRMNKLVECKCIDVKMAGNAGTIITILNYRKYQSNEAQSSTDIVPLSSTENVPLEDESSTEVVPLGSTEVVPLNALGSTNIVPLGSTTIVPQNRIYRIEDNNRREREGETCVCESEDFKTKLNLDQMWIESQAMAWTLTEEQVRRGIDMAEVAFKSDKDFPLDYQVYAMRVRRYISSHWQNIKRLTNQTKTQVNESDISKRRNTADIIAECMS